MSCCKLHQRNAAIMMKMLRKYITWAATILSSKKWKSFRVQERKSLLISVLLLQILEKVKKECIVLDNVILLEYSLHTRKECRCGQSLGQTLRI
jgi:hypothetical protein